LAFLSLPYERFVAGESQSVFNLASTHKDDPSDDPLSNTKERDASADFAAIPETVVLEDGNCEVHDQHQVAMFRAETELSEADTVAWTILSLEVKQMFTHYTDYEELAKGLEATDEKPNQRARGIGIGEDRNLRDEIFALCQRSNYQNPPQDYFPDGAVRRLITEEAVLNEFEQVDNWESLIDLDAFSGLEILRGYPSRSPESFSPWVTENAHKTFANALISDFDSEELAAFMLKFTSRGFTDANLPSIEDIRSISNIIGLSIAKKKMFYNNRWKFLAPIFFSDQHEYLLSDESILPFTKDPAMSQRGAFGTVSKVWIHQDHYKVQIPQEHHKVFTMSSVSKNFYKTSRKADKEQFAIRKLNTQGRSTLINPSIDWEAEASVLQQINKLKHNHLPRCFATIEKGDRRYLMFPWADGGSLRNYWNTREESGPNALLIQETVEQLRGLADGLHHLHNFGKFEKPKAIEAPRTPGEGLPKTIKVTDFLDVNVGSARKRVAVGSAIRLGDLNPENILRVFDEGVDPHRIMERLGTLQIGDLALVKNHLQSADLGNQLEDTGYGTVRYEAPEAMGEVLTRRSRLYDVWSMGCITFEFVVWILHGKNGLGQFYAQLGVRGSFFEYQGRRMPSIVHPVVSTWISHMIDTDPECSRPTAIRDLLQVIRNQLLVVELPSTRVDSAIHSSQRHRATAAEFRDSLDKIVFNISHESADYLHTGMSREHVQPPTRESNVAGAAAKSEYSGGSLESFPRIQIPNTTSNATGGADVQEPQASSGKGFTRTDKWPVPKFTGGQLVHKAVFANGRREKGVFTIFATRRNGAHGYYEYQLQDSNTELIADAGDWTHERDLDSGDRAV
jgi:serine/threonine protein kinase